jgi:hypothetical protein
VFLPLGEAWVPAFVDQFTAFPAGKNDDMVDSATQAITYMLYSSGEVAGLPCAEDDAMVLPALDESYLNSELCYDVYGGA